MCYAPKTTPINSCNINTQVAWKWSWNLKSDCKIT